MGTIVVTRPNGIQIDIDSLPVVLNFDGSQRLTSQSITDTNGRTFVQTFSYTGANTFPDSISAWVQQ